MPDVITCPVCKQVLEAGVRFCPHDGTPLTETAAVSTESTPTGPGRQSGPQLQLPAVVGSRYRLVELRGGGGMAKVYRAVDLTLGRNIVHRDIKPDNLFLLNQSGVRLHIRVLDFGIARIFNKDDPSQGHTLTSPGAVLGTPRYMSPEQLAGQPVDARTDLYSAAVVIHETLTGQMPYVGGK